MDNNSDKEFDVDLIAEKVSARRVKCKQNNAWAAARRIVHSETGEILESQEGKPLTMADISKTWYSEQGGKNNARYIVKRLRRLNQYKCDLKKFRPKFITLTFAELDDSWLAEKAVIKFLDAVRHFAKRHGVSNLAYFWSGEVQERGALHYHILILGLPFLTESQIKEWWRHGFFDVRAVDDLGRAFKYVAKYLWKWGKLATNVDDLPDWWFYFSIFSKRRYGFSKFFTLPPIERVPKWLRETVSDAALSEIISKARPAIGGGWDLEFNFDGVKGLAHFDSPFFLKEL